MTYVYTHQKQPLKSKYDKYICPPSKIKKGWSVSFDLGKENYARPRCHLLIKNVYSSYHKLSAESKNSKYYMIKTYTIFSYKNRSRNYTKGLSKNYITYTRSRESEQWIT